jgi:hypothetical protein
MAGRARRRAARTREGVTRNACWQAALVMLGHRVARAPQPARPHTDNLAHLWRNVTAGVSGSVRPRGPGGNRRAIQPKRRGLQVSWSAPKRATWVPWSRGSSTTARSRQAVSSPPASRENIMNIAIPPGVVQVRRAHLLGLVVAALTLGATSTWALSVATETPSNRTHPTEVVTRDVSSREAVLAGLSPSARKHVEGLMEMTDAQLVAAFGTGPVGQSSHR